jgi:hypothetical protein
MAVLLAKELTEPSIGRSSQEGQFSRGRRWCPNFLKAPLIHYFSFPIKPFVGGLGAWYNSARKNYYSRCKSMADAEPLPSIRERIKDLNTKAYYLLVALSFVYRTSSGSHLLKWALTLTALAAVLPVQDYLTSTCSLEFIRVLKLISLVLALTCTLLWIWTAATPVPAN